MMTCRCGCESVVVRLGGGGRPPSLARTTSMVWSLEKSISHCVLPLLPSRATSFSRPRPGRCRPPRRRRAARRRGARVAGRAVRAGRVGRRRCAANAFAPPAAGLCRGRRSPVRRATRSTTRSARAKSRGRQHQRRCPGTNTAVCERNWFARSVRERMCGRLMSSMLVSWWIGQAEVGQRLVRLLAADVAHALRARLRSSARLGDDRAVGEHSGLVSLGSPGNCAPGPAGPPRCRPSRRGCGRGRPGSSARSPRGWRPGRGSAGT